MTNETLLKRLQEIKLATTGDITLLSALIGDIKQELLTADFTPSERKRFNKCLSYCEKMSKKPHTILAFTHWENDLQYFTDSAFLVELHDSDIMQELPRHDKPYQFKKLNWNEKQAQVNEYPVIKNIFNNYKNNDFVHIDLNFLNKFVNANKGECVILSLKGVKIAFSADLVATAIVWANATKGTAILRFTDNILKPIVIEKDNGTRVIITPVRDINNTAIETYAIND